jgi:hypothetical protein
VKTKPIQYIAATLTLGGFLLTSMQGYSLVDLSRNANIKAGCGRESAQGTTRCTKSSKANLSFSTPCNQTSNGVIFADCDGAYGERITSGGNMDYTYTDTTDVACLSTAAWICQAVLENGTSSYQWIRTDATCGQRTTVTLAGGYPCPTPTPDPSPGE